MTLSVGVADVLLVVIPAEADTAYVPLLPVSSSRCSDNASTGVPTHTGQRANSTVMTRVWVVVLPDKVIQRAPRPNQEGQ